MQISENVHVEQSFIFSYLTAQDGASGTCITLVKAKPLAYVCRIKQALNAIFTVYPLMSLGQRS